MKIFNWFVLCVMVMPLLGQNSYPSFPSPLRGTTILSGSYAEPRASHFHAGIDFKPQKGIGLDTVYAIGKGFISRINVTPDSYGNAIYLDHPNGFTSVYAHLGSFSPKIRRYIENVLYEKEIYSIEHYLDFRDLVVEEGEYIGIMGNTGRSSATHLHFEIRKTDTEVPMNPALFGIKPEDHFSPTIRGIILYSLSTEHEILGKKYYSANFLSSGLYNLSRDPIQSGSLLVGIGIHAYDTMNGASNHNGIYSLKCEVAGKLSFSFQLDSIPFDQSKFIDSHMDYVEKKKNLYVSKCYKNLLNPLNIYQTDSYLGTIPIFEYIPKDVKITIQDFEGNESQISFTIKRSTKLLTNTSNEEKNFLRIMPEDSIVLNFMDHVIELKPRTFLTPQKIKLDSCQTDKICLDQVEEIPLFRYFKISSHMKKQSFFKTKLVFTAINKRGEKDMFAGEWENDSTLVTFVNELKDYFIEPDTIGPKIDIISLPSENTRKVEFSLIDNFTPVYRKDYLSFRVLIDKEWTLCQYDMKSHKISCQLKFNRTGKEHELKIWSSDAVGNISNNSVYFEY